MSEGVPGWTKWAIIYRRLTDKHILETYWNGTREEAERYARAMQFGEYSTCVVLLIIEWDKTVQSREFIA